MEKCQAPYSKMIPLSGTAALIDACPAAWSSSDAHTPPPPHVIRHWSVVSVVIPNFYTGGTLGSSLAERMIKFQSLMRYGYVGGHAGVALQAHGRSGRAWPCRILCHRRQRRGTDLEARRFMKAKE